jgi:hypothetical protein
MGIPFGKCALERPRKRLEGNIMMDRVELGCKDGKLIELRIVFSG